jgi:hypothetical protein
MTVRKSQDVKREAIAAGNIIRDDQNSQPARDETKIFGAAFKPGHSISWFARSQIDHSQTLLGYRYLCRGGGMFVVAPSGMGKSTFSLQVAILWCCGLVAFGIKPARPLRILIVQSEDDDGDCSEMAIMMNHLGLSDNQKQLVEENSELVRCNDLVGLRFIAALRVRLDEARTAGKPFDLVIINPYGSYLGADPKDTAASTQFLVEWLNPLLSEFSLGVILVHHTAKTNFQNTDKYSLWDWAYHGAGAACITNWARSILAIKPESEDMKIHKFIAAKRGRRIGDDWEGKFEKYFAWSDTPGVLLWEEATGEQIAQTTVQKSKHKSIDLDLALKQIPVLDPALKTTVLDKIRLVCNVGEKVARAALDELIFRGKAVEIAIPNPQAGKKGFRSLAGVQRFPLNTSDDSSSCQEE